jgi:hypothetical protein
MYVTALQRMEAEYIGKRKSMYMCLWSVRGVERMSVKEERIKKQR